MPQNRAKNGQFLPGCVANPGGRPKVPADVKEILKAACPDAARELVKFIHHKRPNIAMWAITEILNRVYGKPEVMSKVELSTAEDTKIIFHWINEDTENTATV